MEIWPCGSARGARPLARPALYSASLRRAALERLVRWRGDDRCATLKTCCPNAASVFVTRRGDWSGQGLGPLFASEIRKQRTSHMRGFRQWRWHLDEMYVKIGGEMHYLWRAVAHEVICRNPSSP
jgi:hypothetical protein